MSWNISLRLNNIEQQIKNLQNEGLLNPLEENIQGNGYDILNIKDIDATGQISCESLKTAITSGVTIESSGINCTDINCDSLTSDTFITCDTLNYGTLNPPVSGVSETISRVLQNGNDAQNETLVNLGGLVMTGNLDVNFSQITNWTNGTVGGHLYTANGNPLGTDTRAEFGVFNNNGNNGYIMGIGDQTGTLNEFNTFKIADNTTGQQYFRIDNSATQQITFSADKLLYKTDYTNPANATSYILNSLGTPPMYRQIFSNVNQSITLNIPNINPTYIFGTNIYTGDQVFNYGVTSADILFSYLQITFTGLDPFPSTNNCQLYLGTTPDAVFDPDKCNRIVFGVVNSEGGGTYTFTSSIPIILYYQNGGSGQSFSDLYLNIQIQDANTYTIELQNTNFIVSSYIAGKNTDPLVFNL
jgi:hypothetical protein